MAYARFGNDSDVYLWNGGIGYECSLCLLDERRCTASMATPREALEHLRRHREHGHKVPESAVDDLRDEQVAGYIREAAKPVSRDLGPREAMEDLADEIIEGAHRD